MLGYLYFIKNQSSITTNTKEYCFVEVIPQKEGFQYSNPYNKEVKDEYVYHDYKLVLSESLLSETEKIENQEKLLDQNKYYLYYENNMFGFKKPYSYFVKFIYDKDSSRDIKTKISLDVRCKLMDLLVKEKILTLTN
jgi:hypothetical protein